MTGLASVFGRVCVWVSSPLSGPHFYLHLSNMYGKLDSGHGNVGEAGVKPRSLRNHIK